MSWYMALIQPPFVGVHPGKQEIRLSATFCQGVGFHLLLPDREGSGFLVLFLILKLNTVIQP